MTDERFAPGPAATATTEGLPGGGASSLADGGWHRMHPLTPLFKGGLALLVIAGILIGNLRDQFIYWFVAVLAPGVDIGEDVDEDDGSDPFAWIVENDLIVWALLGLLLVVALVVAAFWVQWRFHEFRITGDDVEVRRGLVFRTHRRAPLDRVQGVNLTRPFPARLVGMAKLEVVGAGTDSNVVLEYLATARAERVRGDILRLASGARAARQAARDAAAGVAAPRERLIQTLNGGVTDLIEGVDLADLAPESVVKVPAGRVVGATLLAALPWFLIGALALAVMLAVSVANLWGDTGSLFAVVLVTVGTALPAFLGLVAVLWSQIARSLRYSIAPTPDGVRVTSGLTTTVTETLPPGRVFAIEVVQGPLWRPFDWWSIRINRMSGKSMLQESSSAGQQLNIVLPVGTRADAHRVLTLLLADMPPTDLPLIWERGLLGPAEGDPFRTMPRRAWWRRPISWRRHGFAVTPFGLLLRRGRIWRRLAVFPLARLQGVSIAQGPLDRLQRLAWAQAHTVAGPVSGRVHGLDRDDAIDLLQRVSRGAVAAAAEDRSHRWLQDAPAPAAPAVGPGSEGVPA